MSTAGGGTFDFCTTYCYCMHAAGLTHSTLMQVIYILLSVFIFFSRVLSAKVCATKSQRQK